MQRGGGRGAPCTPGVRPPSPAVGDCPPPHLPSEAGVRRPVGAGGPRRAGRRRPAPWPPGWARSPRRGCTGGASTGRARRPPRPGRWPGAGRGRGGQWPESCRRGPFLGRPPGPSDGGGGPAAPGVGTAPGVAAMGGRAQLNPAGFAVLGSALLGRAPRMGALR